MVIEKKMNREFTDGYNSALNDILEERGMWAGANKELLNKLREFMNNKMSEYSITFNFSTLEEQELFEKEMRDGNITFLKD